MRNYTPYQGQKTRSGVRNSVLILLVRAVRIYDAVIILLTAAVLLADKVRRL